MLLKFAGLSNPRNAESLIERCCRFFVLHIIFRSLADERFYERTLRRLSGYDVVPYDFIVRVRNNL